MNVLCPKYCTKEWDMLFGSAAEAVQALLVLRNDEEVHGTLRIDVLESYHQLVKAIMIYMTH